MAADSARVGAVKSYFDSWNASDPAALVWSLAQGVTCTDPMVLSQPLAELALEKGHLRKSIDAGPDLSLDVTTTPADDGHVPLRSASKT